MDGFTVGDAAARTGWSPRMLRYLERSGLVVPRRSGSGYRLYALGELNRLASLRALLDRFGITIGDIAFAARLRHDQPLRESVDGWLAGGEVDWVAWEQRKHERLLAA